MRLNFLSAITNEPAPDIRIIRPELSGKLANIVALSISKHLIRATWMETNLQPIYAL